MCGPSDESNEEVGDRANDAIRAVGKALRCKVIGEGANLGMTQRGRIEAALRGIRLNTDAIDNSAGVNTSDVEVNLKIALSLPLHDGRLTWPDRNALLAGMTDEVAALVLRNNYQQTLAISLDQQRGLEDLGFQQRLMQTLEKRHELDRAVEFLPDDSEIAERRRRAIPLTRPEIAVLLAYAKLSLHADLLASKVPDDPYLARELERYFPPSVTTRFPDAVERHRLRRDIISTGLANSMINRGGPTLVVRIADQTGASVDRIAAAFAAVRDSYSLTALNTAIEELDGKIDGGAQLSLFVAVQNLLLDRIVWFLRNVDLGRGLADIVAHYQSGIAAVVDGLNALMPPEAIEARAARAAKLVGEGISEALALRIADLPALTAATDAVLISDRTGKSGRRGRADLLRGARLFPARPRRRWRRRHQGVRLFRAPRPRPRARYHRRRDAPHRRGGDRARHRRHGRHRVDGIEGRRRARARGDPRDRRLGAHARQAVGRREHARGHRAYGLAPAPVIARLDRAIQ